MSNILAATLATIAMPTPKSQPPPQRVPINGALDRNRGGGEGFNFLPRFTGVGR